MDFIVIHSKYQRLFRTECCYFPFALIISLSINVSFERHLLIEGAYFFFSYSGTIVIFCARAERGDAFVVGKWHFNWGLSNSASVNTRLTCGLGQSYPQNTTPFCTHNYAILYTSCYSNKDLLIEVLAVDSSAKQLQLHI